MELKVFNTLGKEVGAIKVSDEVFGAEYNEALIHQVVVAQLANKRQGTKSTLTRTEVRGGGIKPWRQKGTGRARQGSIRSPQWRHGGVVFAPKPRDFSKKINKAMKAAAMVSVLSQKVRQDEIVVLDKIELAEAKTKEMAKICEALNAGKKALFVLGSENEKVVRATNNLPEATVCDATLINVYDLVRAGKVFVTEEAIKVIEEARV
ncbi:MAG: 50S ribosomal protein L4 [Clostridia bacterium]|jgi:large subunit ribosomal protein L4|nr:50S ribosomal protein L4 [Clostridia bacterium]